MDKKTELEKEQQLRRYVLHKNKGVVVLQDSDFLRLRKSSSLHPPFLLNKPPKQNELNIEELPPEILLLIMEYLTPGEAIRFSFASKSIYDLLSDKLLWREIGARFQDYFIWDKLDLAETYTFSGDFQILGYQSDIEERNKLLKNGNISKLKKTINFEKNQYSNLIEDKSTFRSAASLLPVALSTKSERLEYINHVSDPRSEIITRANKLYKKFTEKKSMIQKRNSQNRNFDRYNSKTRIFESLLEIIAIFIPIIIFFFLLLANIHIEKGKLSTFFVFSPILLILIIFLIIISILAYMNPRDRIGIMIAWSVVAFLVLMVFFIVLKSNGTINWKWYKMLFPLDLAILVFMVFALYSQLRNIYYRRWSEIHSTWISFSSSFLFFLLISLRADQIIHLNYFFIFIFLWIPLFTAFGMLFFTRPPFSYLVFTVLSTFVFCGFGFLLICFFLHHFFVHFTFCLIPFYIPSILISFLTLRELRSAINRFFGYW